MKLFFRYLKDLRFGILLFLFCFVVTFVSFLLFRLPLAVFLYTGFFWLLAGILFLVAGFLRVKKTHTVFQSLDENDPVLPPADSILAGDFKDLAVRAFQKQREDRADSEAEQRSMIDYYTMWAHQIKTPIASMRLRLQNGDHPDSASLLGDLGRIERYVEMVMTYLRLEGPGTDYVFSRHDLDEILRAVFKEFASEFIGRKLQLLYEPAKLSVLTDRKWLSFVLGQILSNALKYTPSGSVSVYVEAPATLCISDTGIGISPEDLPRIFDRNYTGVSGRTDRFSSGIGLYLSKRILDGLGHRIEISSLPDAGTTVRIDLSDRSLPLDQM